MWGVALQLFGALLLAGDSYGGSERALGGGMVAAGLLFPLVPLASNEDTRRLVQEVRSRSRSASVAGKAAALAGLSLGERAVAKLEGVVRALDAMERPVQASRATSTAGMELRENPVLLEAEKA
jgi:hypothetical protein